MLWALIENGSVKETTNIDPEGRFHPSMLWVECSSEVMAGWIAEFVEGNWVFTEPQIIVNLDELASSKRSELRSNCSDSITRSSFQSDALGALHNYDCRVVDQLNLKIRYDISTISNNPEPLWASDGTRFQWIMHSATEILGVMTDMNEHIKANQVRLASKLALVDAATTASEIETIEW